MRRLLILLLLSGLALPAAAEIPLRTEEGFLVPQPTPSFTFPRDHGSHPDFKIEWWYLTGHLSDSDNPAARYGFQATFFRSASPLALRQVPASPAFGHEQLYLAHMALIELSTGRFLHQERLNREGWDASASTETLAVHNGDWSLELIDEATSRFRLRGGIRGDAQFSLELTAAKPLARFGEQGYSRKGAKPTAASYYLTYSRLSAAGSLRLDGTERRVTGQAWMDHEYSSSQLDNDQVGWDWLSAQLHDGREIMAYRLRLKDGTSDPASTLTWILPDGTLEKRPFRWSPETTWTSPHTGATYPQRVRLETEDPKTGQPIAFWIVPFHPDQELGGSLGGVTYWEGACRLVDAKDREVALAYMELTGYDRPLEVLK